MRQGGTQPLVPFGVPAPRGHAVSSQFPHLSPRTTPMLLLKPYLYLLYRYSRSILFSVSTAL